MTTKPKWIGSRPAMQVWVARDETTEGVTVFAFLDKPEKTPDGYWDDYGSSALELNRRLGLKSGQLCKAWLVVEEEK